MMKMNFFSGMTDERRLTLFPAGIIVRDPHHCESRTRLQKGLELCRACVQAYLTEVVQ